MEDDSIAGDNPRRLTWRLPQIESVKKKFPRGMKNVGKIIQERRPKLGISEYYARKRENHALAVELWEKYATPEAKGMTLDYAKDESMLKKLTFGKVVKKGGDAGADMAKVSGRAEKTGADV